MSKSPNKEPSFRKDGFNDAFINQAEKMILKAHELKRKGIIEEGLSFFEKALVLYKQQIEMAPPGRKEKLTEFYRGHLQTLKSMYPTDFKHQESIAQIETNYFCSPIQEEFVEDDVKSARNMLPETPESSTLNPFYYLSMIVVTIENGTFITPKIFVPRKIWFQKDVDNLDIDKKVFYFRKLIERIKKLQGIYAKNSSSKERSELEEFIQFSHFFQYYLARDYGHEKVVSLNQYTQMPNHVKKFADELSQYYKISTQTNIENYSKVIKELYIESLFLQEWITKMETKEEEDDLEQNESNILISLSTISEFFSSSILGLLLKDINTLLVKYLHDTCNIFCKSMDGNENMVLANNA